MIDNLFSNKKILLICRETYSKPLWFAAERLKEKNEVAAFFIMSSECSYSKCYYNEHTYFEFKENLKDVKLYDVRDICDEFTKNLREKECPMDMDYLAMLDEEYTHYKSLNMQLMSSQMNTRHYHYRTYWKHTSYEENSYWLELNYRKIIQILEEFEPDVILDLDNAELQRTILCEVAYKKNIPYMTVEYGKYGYYKYASFQNSFGIDPYFKNVYEKNLKNPKEEMEEEYQYIEKFREEVSIMNKEYAGSVTCQYERDSLFWIMRVMRGKWNYFWDQDIRKKNWKLKRTNKMLYVPSMAYMSCYLKAELRKRMLYGKNKYFENPVEGEDYVYMPLHLIPESSVFVKASYYVDELNLIEQISKSLPIGWKLYVKEHQAMLGERSLEFYEKVKELHNVRMVQVNYYKDPKPWITKSKGVVTITGTAAYEAALLGMRSVVFGDVPFSVIDGITRIRSFEDLGPVIRSFGPIDNMHSAAAYLYTVKEVGAEVKIFYLQEEAERIFSGKSIRGEEFDVQMDELMRMYEKGYTRYLNGEVREV